MWDGGVLSRVSSADLEMRLWYEICRRGGINEYLQLAYLCPRPERPVSFLGVPAGVRVWDKD